MLGRILSCQQMVVYNQMNHPVMKIRRMKTKAKKKKQKQASHLLWRVVSGSGPRRRGRPRGRPVDASASGQAGGRRGGLGRGRGRRGEVGRHSQPRRVPEAQLMGSAPAAVAAVATVAAAAAAPGAERGEIQYLISNPS